MAERFQVIIVDSEGGEHKSGEPFPSLSACTEHLVDLEIQFNEWQASTDYPEAPPNAVIGHYEGCDVYAVGTESGCRWLENDEGEWDLI